jgi:hypothetical protein
MSTLDFLQDLENRGVVLSPRNGKLKVDAPVGALTDDDRTLLSQHRTELLDLLIDDTAPADLPPEWHQRWDERAAMMEYDGGLHRERAEALALKDILQQMHRARNLASQARKEMRS